MPVPWLPCSINDKIYRSTVLDSQPMDVLGWILVLGLALVHIEARRLRRLDRLLHQRWRSFAGGVAIAYIFLEVLPELAEAQRNIERLNVAAIAFLEQHIYLLALVGLILFYGLESFALQSKQRRDRSKSPHDVPSALFWIHISAFAVNTTILGYLFQEQTDHGLVSCLFLFGALALHFFVIDHGLREHHQHVYDQIGRWLLAGSIILGWVVGQNVPINETGISIVWAFVSGGIILNVLKEELPEQSQSSFRVFCIGAGVYTILLLLV